MGFVVGFTFIIWLLVAIIAFGSRMVQLFENVNEKSSKRSIKNEK